MSKKEIQPKWCPPENEYVEYEPWQQAMLARLESETKGQLASDKRRLEHSLSVAREAEYLGFLYDVDPYLCRVCGYLHDWYKVVPKEELIEKGYRLGIDLGVPLEKAEPLLHGMVAARELPERFPHLPHAVWHAIATHTSAAEDMSPLDMVLFVADGIEPLRRSSPGIAQTRSLVSEVSLEDLFWNAFVGGIVYVIEGGRYLLPRTIEIYNSLAQDRAWKKHR